MDGTSQLSSSVLDLYTCSQICTAIMGVLYGALGTIGYWSAGSGIKEIVIFSLPESPRQRVAAACILVQVRRTSLSTHVQTYACMPLT